MTETHVDGAEGEHVFSADSTVMLRLFEPHQRQPEVIANVDHTQLQADDNQWQGLTALEPVGAPHQSEYTALQVDQTNQSLPICYFCGKQIADEFILHVLGKAWHSNCLRCSDCGELLQERCFVLNPLTKSEALPQAMTHPLLCREDFSKRSAARCPRCQVVLSEGDLVRKAQDFTFHSHCFACVACQRELMTGQLFYVLSDSTLLCKFHFETAKERQNRILVEGAALAASSPQEAAAFFQQLNIQATGGWGEAALALIRAPIGLGGITGALSGGHNSLNGPDGPKRPRTTINSLQLELLRRAYETSSKPPRHIREQLSQDTGLDMRVVQVWFQNKRAKEKRMRKDPSSSASGRSALFGGNINDSSVSSANFERRRDDDDEDEVVDDDSMPSVDDDGGDEFVVD